MNKKLKIFTMTALLGVLTAGCANSNANINTLDKNLMNLEASVRNSIAGNASDFFINEFDCPACDSVVTAKYNARTNVLEIGPTVRDNNTRPLINKNVDTYRKNANRTVRNTAGNSTNANANNTNGNLSRGTTFYGNYFITDGSYTPRYSELRDESVVANKVKNIENLYSIAYDVSLAKSQFNELRDELLTQIDNTRSNLESYENLNEAQQNALNQYALTIRNIINTINNSNELYKNNMVITGSQNIIDNQAYRSAQYINMLNCIDTQISALENAIATLDMINNSILTDADKGFTTLPNKDTDRNVVIDDNSIQNPTTNNTNNTVNNPTNNTNNNLAGNNTTNTNNNTTNNVNNTNHNVNNGVSNNANRINNNNNLVNNTNRTTNNGIVPNIDTMDSNLNGNRVVNNGINTNNGVNNSTNGVNNGLVRNNNTNNGLNNTLIPNRNVNTPINSGRNISNMPYNSNMANNSANGINNTVVNNANSGNRIVNSNNANRNANNGIVPNIDTMDSSFNRNTVVNNNANNTANNFNGVNLNNNLANGTTNANLGGYLNNTTNNLSNNTAINNGTNTSNVLNNNGINNVENNDLNGENGNILNNANNIASNRGEVVRNTDSYNIPTVRNNVNTYNYNTLGEFGGNRAVNGNQNLPSSANTLLNNQTPPPTAERYMNNRTENKNTILNNADKIKVDDNNENKNANDGIMLLDKTNDKDKTVNLSRNEMVTDKKDEETQHNHKMPLIESNNSDKNTTSTADTRKYDISTNNTTIKRSVNVTGPKVNLNDGEKISSNARA